MYQTRKTNYQAAVLYDLVEKVTMPPAVFSKLFNSPTGNCASVTGSRGAKLQFDEFIESHGVRTTKHGSRMSTFTSVIQSFYTTAGMCFGLPAMQEMIKFNDRKRLNITARGYLHFQSTAKLFCIHGGIGPDHSVGWTRKYAVGGFQLRVIW
eukprot:IDg10004t1